MKQLICSRVTRVMGTVAAVLLLSAPGLAAQTGSIAGRVTNAGTGEPVGAAQVFIEALSNGVLTRPNGSYLLLNVPAGTHTVTVQRIGFSEASAEVQLAAGATATLDFQVREEALRLDEVVVTGTVGQQTRRAVANSITTVDAAQVTNQVPIANMQEMLNGRTPGVTYNRTGGVVGAGAPVNVRGFSSILLGNQPLIYVDGVRVDNSFNLGPDAQYAGYQDFAGSSSSALDDINANDIESIEVIKGPAAATLYGSEASAGVIQIITKKGVVGAPEFDLTVRQGQNFWINPAGILGDMYGCPYSSSFFSRNYQLNRHCGNDPWTTVNEDSAFSFNIIDYHKDKYGRDIVTSGYASGYNLGVRGGTDQVRYYVSGDWSDDTGIVDYNYAQKLALRTNVDVLFSEDLTVSFNAGFTDGLTSYSQQHRNQGGFYTEMIWAQGDQIDDTLYNPGGPGAPGGQPSGSPSSDGFYERDPGYYADVESTRDYQRLTTSLTAQHTVGEWLTQRLVFGLDRDWGVNDYVVPRSAIATNFPFPNTSDGQVDRDNDVNQRISFSYNASVPYELNDMFTFTTSIGADYNANERTRFSESGDGLPSPSLKTLASITDPNDPQYSYSDTKSLGYFLQEAVTINDRLYLTGAIRADDNSSFGSSSDLLVYPKAQVSWIISEEPFWNLGLFDELRLRTAYGKSGRAPGALEGTTFVGDFVGPAGTSALIYSDPGNVAVSAEESAELEAGFDFAMLDQRFSGEFTWFKQWVRDAIVNQTLTPSNGLKGSVQSNLGAIDNWGWEAAMDIRVMRSPSFSFDLHLSADHTDNRIKTLNEEQQNDNFVEGYYYPNVASIVVDSVSKVRCQNSSGARVSCSSSSNIYTSGVDYTITDAYDGTIGWLGWCDVGDPNSPYKEAGSPSGLFPGGPSVPCDTGAVDRNQELMIGRGFAPYSYNISPTFRFLNNSVEVTALIQGQYGRWYDDGDASFRGAAYSNEIGYLRQNSYASVVKTDPVYLVGRVVNDDHYQGRIDVSFWRLREISARYQLPGSLLDRVGVNRASLAVSARNLWFLWRRSRADKGGTHIADPENVGALSYSPNIGLEQVPSISSFAVTLRVAF